jgi:hypothetical protein
MRKRRPAKLMLGCLLLGAVINVLAAWGLVIVHADRIEERSRSARADDFIALWRQHVPPTWLREPTATFFSTPTAGLESITMLTIGDDSNDSLYRSVGVLRAGWPQLTLESSVVSDGNEPEYRTSTGLIKLPLGLRERRFPYGPLWPGLIINTIFYAAVVWLMIRGPIETRRRWRERRGTCGACGYPRGESSVCTECGSDLTGSWGSPQPSIQK